MSKQAANIYLIEDHPLFREGVANLIRRQPDLRVCGEASTAEDAMKGIQRAAPRIVILDLSLKEGSGFDLIKTIRAKLPDAAVIILSMHDERRYAERCIRAGARGYVMKGEAPNTVIDAIREVLDGKSYLSQQMRSVAVERFVEGSQADSSVPQNVLSARELEVFELLGQGYETRRVAEMLGLNIKTVQTFCAKIKDKLHLANAAELMREAVRWSAPGPTG